MADYAAASLSIAVLTAAFALLFRSVRGRAATKLRATGRVLLSLVLALLLVGVGTYQLSKSRTFQVAGKLVARVGTEQKVVALTFDDGPTPGYTEWVLRELEAHDARATFYLVGAACEDDPALLGRIVSAGHELGNHTYSHPRLYFTPEAAVAEEVERTDAIFREAGYDGPITFRPPGSKRLLTTPMYLARTGRTTVTWDLEPDSIGGIADDADAMTDYVVENVRPGSIVLMHVMYDSREPSRRALPRILERLKSQGYRFVTVSELIAMRG